MAEKLPLTGRNLEQDQVYMWDHSADGQMSKGGGEIKQERMTDHI